MARFYDETDVMHAGPTKEGLDGPTFNAIDDIKRSGQQLHEVLSLLPQSAEMTLAKRKVEEAVMWAVKAITA